jgi:competence protein ComEA
MLCWAVLTTFFLARLVLRGAAPEPDRPFARTVRVDVNRATIPELMALPGMGRTRAAAVVLHRVRHGPFRRLDDLTAVDGIGPITLERLRPFLVDVGR